MHNGCNGFVCKYAHTLLCRANLSLIAYQTLSRRYRFPRRFNVNHREGSAPLSTTLLQHDGKQVAGFFFAQYVAGPLLSRGNLRSRGESGSYLNNHSVTRRLLLAVEDGGKERNRVSETETRIERGREGERGNSLGTREDKRCETRGKRAARPGGGGPDTITWCKSNRASRNHPVRLTRPFSDWFLEERASTVNFYIALSRRWNDCFLRDPIYRAILNSGRWTFSY